jgi:hypothetical protein
MHSSTCPDNPEWPFAHAGSVLSANFARAQIMDVAFSNSESLSHTLHNAPLLLLVAYHVRPQHGVIRMKAAPPRTASSRSSPRLSSPKYFSSLMRYPHAAHHVVVRRLSPACSSPGVCVVPSVRMASLKRRAFGESTVGKPWRTEKNKVPGLQPIRCRLMEINYRPTVTYLTPPTHLTEAHTWGLCGFLPRLTPTS